MLVYDENIRASLSKLADVDWQRRVWTGRGMPDEMDSFQEQVEQLYTDTGLGDALERGGRVYDSRIDRALAELLQLLKAIRTDRSADALIEDPAMADVRRLSRSILDDLEAITPGWTREVTRPS
jgi:hypothetical protein